MCSYKKMYQYTTFLIYQHSIKKEGGKGVNNNKILLFNLPYWLTFL